MTTQTLTKADKLENLMELQEIITLALKLPEKTRKLVTGLLKRLASALQKDDAEKEVSSLEEMQALHKTLQHASKLVDDDIKALAKEEVKLRKQIDALASECTDIEREFNRMDAEKQEMLDSKAARDIRNRIK